MEDIEQYKQYGEQIARRHKAIGHSDTERHYTMFTAEDALSGLRNMESPLLAAELPEIRFVDEGSDNVHMVMNGAYLILKKCRAGEGNAIVKAYEEMHVIALDIVRKFLNDRRMALKMGRKKPESLLHHLQVNGIHLVDVGPVFENYYGWRIDFPCQTAIEMDLDKTKWIGEVAFI